MVFTHLCMLAWPCIKMLSVPHVGWGGADNIDWDPQCGGISWMPIACNLVIIFVLICTYTHLILIVLTMLLWLICTIVPMLEFVNKLVYGTRAHQNTWGRVSQAWKRVWKRDNEVWNLCNIQYIWCGCQQMCRWTMVVLPHMCSGFPAKIMEQMIMTSLYDVTRFCHATSAGNYRRRV